MGGARGGAGCLVVLICGWLAEVLVTPVKSGKAADPAAFNRLYEGQSSRSLTKKRAN